MMEGSIKRLLGVTALALLTVGAVGCAGGRMQQERDALWVQNQELQEELNQARSALDAAEADRRELLDRLDGAQAAGGTQPTQAAQRDSGFEDISGVETIQDPDKITVRVPGDVLFAPGQVQLRNSARETLSEVADVLRSEHSGNTVRIEGYTDTDPIQRSQWTDNLELSLQRAATVHRYLQEQGVPPERMYAAGFGEWHPRDTKERSRRVEIVVELY